MRASYRLNPIEIMTEVLASVYRCEKEKKKATVGQVERHIINIRISRALVVQALTDLHMWGLLEVDTFMYRPTVKAKSYRLNAHSTARNLTRSLLRYDEKVICYFPELEVKS